MKFRKKLRFAAIGMLLVYSAFRFGLVNVTLTSYGVNPWVFLGLDLATTVTYVIGVEMLIVALIGKKDYPLPQTVGWGLLAAMSFALPYLYLFLWSKEVPTSLLFGLGIIILLLLASAVASIVRQVRRRSAK